MEVKIYDTTLRDGTQAEDFCFSADDKVRIALKLDDHRHSLHRGRLARIEPEGCGLFPGNPQLST